MSLPKFASFQEAHERLRRILEPHDDILAVADLAGGYQFRHLVIVGRPLIGKLTLDEAAAGEAARQDGPHDHRKLVGTRMLHGVVLRDQAAHGNARELVQQRKDRIPNVPTDILEINVDPVWARVPPAAARNPLRDGR